MTDADGNITNTFAYDTYGKLISRTGMSAIIFGYNGRDGVITEANGLIYMRARYYSPDMRRFVNADVVAGTISKAVTLNRFAYVNGNPVSYVDPFGLSAERDGETSLWDKFTNWLDETGDSISDWWDDTSDAISDWWDENKDNAEDFIQGVDWVVVGATAVVVGMTVITCGVATPVMLVIAGTTVAAGVATTVNGAAEIGEAFSDYNFVRDGLFDGNEKAYNIYSNTTAMAAQTGTMVSGAWLTYNAPRINAYNNIQNYQYSGTISKEDHMVREYANSVLTQKQVIKYGEMIPDLAGYKFQAFGSMNGGSDRAWSLVVDTTAQIAYHWGYGF